MEPAEELQITRPSGSVMVICVLLKEAAMCASPWGTVRRSFFFLNSFFFLSLPVAAGFAGCASGAVFCCSFATIDSSSQKSVIQCRSNWQAKACRYLALLALDMFLAGNRAAAWTLAGARVGVRALAANRQVAAVTNAAVGLDFNQAPDIHLDLFAKIAFHTAFLLDDRADAVHFVFRELADLFRRIHIRLFGDCFRAHLSDAIDRGQPDPKALLRRKINTCDTCHDFSSIPLVIPGAACASGWCRLPEPPRGDGSPCTCHKFS